MQPVVTFIIYGNACVTFQGKITAQGKLLQQDTFSVSEQENGLLSRAKERRVFLFEQLVIFSEPIDKKKGLPLPGYTFKNSIKVTWRCAHHICKTSLSFFILKKVSCVVQVSCLGVEEHSEEDPCCLVLTSRGTDLSVTRFFMHASSPEIKRAWFDDVVQILETQRNFLNGTRTQCFRRKNTRSPCEFNAFEWVRHLFSAAALQSPIEYQRRESKTNSLGRNIKSPTATASDLWPHTSASMDRRQQPGLLPYNTSLLSWHPQQHSLASKAVSVYSIDLSVGIDTFPSFSFYK